MNCIEDSIMLEYYRTQGGWGAQLLTGGLNMNLPSPNFYKNFKVTHVKP